ncbi:MAG TPA: tetratricopeptide repeat protein [Pyrinomonadaceae bacterium]|nr:tetratricopeptide repeat protein [Pyrinomonadaceae bacterium]
MKMSTLYCALHLVHYGLGTMCPECRREQANAAQQDLIELQREAASQREALMDSIREAEHKRLNPGNYQCDACKLTTLLAGASRCPICRADVRPEYWPSVRAREAIARKAADAAKKKAEDARKKACDAAVATVELGLEHTEQLWEEAFQESKRKQESQGFLSRLIAPLPRPSELRKYRFEITESSASNGRWTTQPVLILGVTTLDSDIKLGFKHYRFPTPFEYIAVFRYLKTMEEQFPPTVIEQAIAVFQRWADQNWSFREPGNSKRQPDYSEALQRYREGAAQGDAAAQFELGRMHANGMGVPQDYAEALKWYRKAADQGHAGAQRNIGVMYANGQAVAQDYAEALKWYRKAADQGDAQAQYKIGWMYANGQAVAQDYAETLKWYRKAADQGDASAQRYIGFMHASGQGVPQDYAEALKWYRKAADQGDVTALRNIGVMYHKGQSVPQDYAEALKWYRKAADQVDPQFYIDLIGGKFDR